MLYRYRAIPISQPGGVVGGEISADTVDDAKASLRRIGLQPVRIRATAKGLLDSLPLHGLIARRLRARRAEHKAELFDALSTMLGAGASLSDALVMIGKCGGRASRTMLVGLRDSVTRGSTLAESMRDYPSWFDASEIAMVDAAQHTGRLPEILSDLAARHERGLRLAGKVAGAMAYPAVVAVVGFGVAVFLSTSTLPRLVGILEDAGIKTPVLTHAVMATGKVTATHGIPALLVLGIAAVAGPWFLRHKRLRTVLKPHPRLIPAAFRRASLAWMLAGIADMVRAGVPAVQALRVLGPTASGLGRSSLEGVFVDAADRIECGETLTQALSGNSWFDVETLRLIEIGEASGEIPDVLARVADRQARSAERAIARIASLLEPAVILVLSGVVGVIVMAAVLPLVRLQEVL